LPIVMEAFEDLAENHIRMRVPAILRDHGGDALGFDASRLAHDGSSTFPVVI
jgi:hypothetical protein